MRKRKLISYRIIYQSKAYTLVKLNKLFRVEGYDIHVEISSVLARQLSGYGIAAFNEYCDIMFENEFNTLN